MSADYGRTVGSATNVIVKSGTNRFHGDFLYSRTEEDWNEEFDSHPELADKQFCRGQEAGVVPLQCEANFFLCTDIEKASSDDQHETGLGGPLKRDKVWFFLSANRQNSNRTGKTKNGDAVDESGTLESRIIKLNFQAGASNSIAVNYIDTPVFRNFRLEPVYDRYAMTPHDISGELYSLSWNWLASSSVFVEFKAASQTSNEDKLLAFGGFDVDEAISVKQEDDRFPAADPLLVGPDYAGNNFSPYLDGDGWHNGWLLDNGFGTNEYPRDQYNIGITQFAGSNHELRYGVDARQVEWLGDVERLTLYSSGGDNRFCSTARSGFINDFPSLSLPLAYRATSTREISASSRTTTPTSWARRGRTTPIPRTPRSTFATG